MKEPPAAPEVAVVHDYLNQRGGAERVVAEMTRMWPAATVYTSLYRPGSTLPDFKSVDVRTTFLDRVPVDRRFRALLPLFPLAFRSLGRLDHEVVLSSSSGWAHGVRTAPGSTHVVYCYAPARWLYEPHSYHSGRAPALAMRPFAAALKQWDQQAARRPDAYIAISENVRKRIADVYGRESEVVYPPVETSRFKPTGGGERLLVISRMLPYKRVDLAIEAARRTGLGLDVVGTGPMLERLRADAGPGVRFHGSVGDEEITALLESCWALCMPGSEDFGIVPIEANAAGKPVIAFDSRGARETVIDGRTGVLFEHQTVESVVDAIRRTDSLRHDPEDVATQADRFSTAEFRRRLSGAISRARESHA